MSIPQGDFSTLEVDARARDGDNLPEVHDDRLPQVDHDATADQDYPQAAFGHGLVPKDSQRPDGSPVPNGPAAPQERVCGLKRKTLWIVVVVASMVIAGAVAGAVAGTLTRRQGSADPQSGNNSIPGPETPNPSNITVFANTSLSSVGWMDASGHEHAIVLYQLSNRAIFISACNLSVGQWFTSPVVSGTNGTRLEDIPLGTPLAIDGYLDGRLPQGVYVHWESLDNEIRTLVSHNPRTDTALAPEAWDRPADWSNPKADQFSRLASYAKSCSTCLGGKHMIFQNMAFENMQRPGLKAQRNSPTEGGWTTWGPVYTKWFQPDANLNPDAGRSIAVAEGPTKNGTRILNVYYRTGTGILAKMTYDGNESYSIEKLDYGVSDRLQLGAFSDYTARNDTKIRVVVAEPQSPLKAVSWLNGVTQSGGEALVPNVNTIDEARECEAKGIITVSQTGRLYCLVVAAGPPRIEEYKWIKGQGERETAPTIFKHVGTVKMTLEKND